MKEQLLKALERLSIEIENHIALRLILLPLILAIISIIIVCFSLAFFIAVTYVLVKEVYNWVAGYKEKQSKQDYRSFNHYF